MRVTRRLHDDDRGAVAVMYALALVAFLGLLALVMDLGRAVAVKRDMVNGADAAALGAAQECVLRHDPLTAEAIAADLTTQNKTGASVTSFSAPDCEVTGTMTGSRAVTVGTVVPVDYYVAPVIGFENVDVVADATAIYGPIGSAAAVPITVNYETLLGCGIPTSPPVEGEVVQCGLSYPKDTLQEPRWGVLDLDYWNDPDAAPCMVSADEARDIIVGGGYYQYLSLNPEGQPTYDCLDNGLSHSVWEELEGRELIFPVIDIPTSTGETKPGGEDCMGAQPNCQIDTANVLAWVVLYVPVGGVTQHGDTVFVQAEWAGSALTNGGIPCPLGDESCNAPDFGAYAVRLVD